MMMQSSGEPAVARGQEPVGRPEVSTAKRVDERGRSPDQGLSLCFRFLQLAASVISFVVLFKAAQLDLRFQSYMAFRFLLVVGVIAAAWSLLMLLLELLQVAVGKKLRFAGWRAFVYLGDWLVALLLLSAASAAAAITTFNDRGLVLFNYAPCVGPTPYSTFCSRTKTSVAFAFIAFGFFLPHLVLSTVGFLVRVLEG